MIPDKHVICWKDVPTSNKTSCRLLTNTPTTPTSFIPTVPFWILTVQHTEALAQDTAHSHLALWLISQLEKKKELFIICWCYITPTNWLKNKLIPICIILHYLLLWLSSLELLTWSVADQRPGTCVGFFNKSHFYTQFKTESCYSFETSNIKCTLVLCKIRTETDSFNIMTGVQITSVGAQDKMT